MEELSQHILDICFNSLEAGAKKIDITVQEDIAENLLEFKVLDNGRGFAAQDMENLLDPFYTTKKDKPVGLGLPLLKEAVERCDGSLHIAPMPKGGTLISATFPYNHLDRAPLGDMAGTLMALMAGHSSLRLTYRHRYANNTFYFDTQEIREKLEAVSLQSPQVLVWLGQYITANIANLKEAIEIEELGRTG